MSHDRSTGTAGNTNSIMSNLGAMGAQVGISITTHLALTAFERMMGVSYSQANINRLSTLREIYATHLNKTAPAFWELDDKNKPKFRVINTLSDYVRQSYEKLQIKNYYSQSSFIISCIANYLSERRKRFIGRGTPGDVVEHFMCDWIRFASDELPNLQFDDASIAILNQRIKYLEAVQKHLHLFKFGWITRKINKFYTMEYIRRALLDCVELAKKEAFRTCAREKFKICRDNMTGLLTACANSIYYARAQRAYNAPLNIKSFLEPEVHSAFLSPYDKEVYAKIKLTPTGLMLQELIQLSGLESFGEQGANKANESANSLVYFNDDCSPKPINWDLVKEKDLPPWLSQLSKGELQKYFTLTQAMLASTLRIARLKQLVEEVYDLVGKLGDLWAYGDERGRLSLEGLLFLLEKELALFSKSYNDWYTCQDSQRRAYNLKRKVNQDTNANQNFNQVDMQKEIIETICVPLKNAVKDIHDKMESFSQEEINYIDSKKQLFYQSVAKYVTQYYPAEAKRFALLLQPLSAEENVVALGLDKPIIEKHFFNEAFILWKKEFFAKHKAVYVELASLMDQFEMNPECRQELFKKIQGHLGGMRVIVKAERPVWRLKRPLSCGWPFNQHLSKNLDIILKELESIESDIQGLIRKEERAEKRGEAPRHEKVARYAKIHLLEGGIFNPTTRTYEEKENIGPCDRTQGAFVGAGKLGTRQASLKR